MALPMPREAPVTMDTGASTSFGKSATAAAASDAAACARGASQNVRRFSKILVVKLRWAWENRTDAIIVETCNCDECGNAMHPCCSRCTVPQADDAAAHVEAAILFLRVFSHKTFETELAKCALRREKHTHTHSVHYLIGRIERGGALKK